MQTPFVSLITRRRQDERRAGQRIRALAEAESDRQMLRPPQLVPDDHAAWIECSADAAVQAVRSCVAESVEDAGLRF